MAYHHPMPPSSIRTATSSKANTFAILVRGHNPTASVSVSCVFFYASLSFQWDWLRGNLLLVVLISHPCWDFHAFHRLQQKHVAAIYSIVNSGVALMAEAQAFYLYDIGYENPFTDASS
jgi:hypothetical protein